MEPVDTCGEASTGHDARCGLYFPAAFAKRIFAIHGVANSGFRYSIPCPA